MWWLGLAAADEVDVFLGWLDAAGLGGYRAQVERDVLDPAKRAWLAEELRRPSLPVPVVRPRLAPKVRWSLGVRPMTSARGASTLGELPAQLGLTPHALPTAAWTPDAWIGADCLTNPAVDAAETFCPLCRYRARGAAEIGAWAAWYEEQARYIDRFEE